jgi:hypothetical protein
VGETKIIFHIDIIDPLIVIGLKGKGKNIGLFRAPGTGSTISAHGIETLDGFNLVVPVYTWSVREVGVFIVKRRKVLAVGEVSECKANDGADENVLPVICASSHQHIDKDR